ncbi:MAG: bifunctional oligoribonuclease/PAP phosphatase NrnA [Desulfobacterales bacterium]|nr:bifunctional oligoribonuclease/PAP phosphatase NrnA [Desulfobacterales bacterium]
MSHIQPDGDALGSMLAMGLFLEKLGKTVTMFNENQVPAIYRFLPQMHRIVQSYEDINKFDAAIILDCGDLKRIGEIYRVIEHIPLILNIDHHSTNTKFGHYQLINPDACATVEIIYHLIKEVGITIDLDIAYSIYTGILTDTGSFRFQNTNGDSFKIAMEMIELGVQPYLVASKVYDTYSLGRIKLLNMVLDSIELSANGKMSIMLLTSDMLKETGIKIEDVDGLINYAKQIEDVKVAALIQEISKNTGKQVNGSKGLFHVSLRSNGGLDVSSIALVHGGGGHKTAAGFSIESTLLDIKNEMFCISERL